LNKFINFKKLDQLKMSENNQTESTLEINKLKNSQIFNDEAINRVTN